MKNSFLSILVLLFYGSTLSAQLLTISSTGQIGTSGTNWSTSGTNPVTITASGGAANVNTSVILLYLNAGTSVIVQNNDSNGSVGIISDLTKSAGGDATLTLRGNLQAYVSAPITSTSSKINVILWSDYNNNNVGGVAVGAAAVINTNGGHFWAGGSSTPAGSYTWNGLTVGNGPSVGSSGANNFGMDLFTSQINTNNGDILLWSGIGVTSQYDGIGMQNNPQLNAGSGNVTLITRQIFNNNTLSVTTTGKLALATDASNPWTSDFNWATTTSGSNVTLSSALGRPLQINNFSTLGGLSVGIYDGFGSSFNYTNLQNVNINSSINIPGPINVYAGAINLGVGVDVFASTASGSINFQAKGGFFTVANSGSIRGKLMTTGGGDITVNADADNNNLGELNIDWLTIDGTNGDILLEGSTFMWNTGAQVTLPEFYSNSGTLTIRNVTSSNYAINTQWIAMFGTYAGITLGREGGTDSVLFNPCIVCVSTARNFGTTAFQIAGPITALGGNINVNMNLISTSVGADILLKSARTIIVEENRTIQTNNGDITFWSNSDGIANLTDGDFIGLNSGVVVNSSNGLTGQSTGGGTITIAGGTTSQTLASGTIVPTGYAFSNRTTNWGGVHPSGVNFGKNFQTVSTNSISVHSGGGDIVVKGQAGNAVPGVAWFRGASGAQQVMQSGSGTITFVGDNTSTGHGIELSYFSLTNTIGPTITSSNTSTAAISVTGSTVATGTAAGYQGSATFIANAAGGGVRISGQTANVNTYGAIEASELNAYALSGPITFISEGGLGLRVGGTWGKGTLPSSTSNITLRSDRFSIYPATTETTGTISVESLGTTFTSAITFPITNLTIPNTVSGLTIGKSTNTSTITFASAVTIAGPIMAYGGVVTANANITTSNASSISLLAKSGLRFSSSGITLQTSGGDVVLSGDHDANSSGNIIAEGALTITSNGGAIAMGGGTTGSDFAYGIGTSSTIANDQTAGIWVRGAVNLNSGNGNISIRGYAANASPTVQHVPSWGVGLGLSAVYNTNPASVSINSGTGTILIEGYARNPSGSNSNSYGVVFNNWEATTTQALTITSANTTVNAIRLIGNTENTLNGQRTKNSLRFWSVNSNIRATGTGGGITLSGKTFDNNDHPQICWSGGNILATSGPIVINSENEAVEIGNDLYLGSRSGITGNTSSSSNIRFSMDDFSVASGIIRVASTGSLTIEPFGSSFTDYTPLTNTIIGFTADTRWSLNENAQTLTGLTIGKPLNTSNITFGSATTIAGPITAYGGNIAINGALTATNADINLYATGTVTQSAALTATKLGLNGTGNFTLQNSNNNCTTLAGGNATTRLGNIAYRDANALEVGTVNTNGIFSSGTILVETENGNLTLSQNLNTTSTSLSAIILNAGRPSAINTRTGGNIIINGSPTLSYGTGGQAKLFSGFEQNTSGLTALVGASNIRYSVDETTTTFSPVLATNNSYALYRGAKEGTGNLTIVATGGDAEGTTWTYTNGIITTVNPVVNILNTDIVTKLATGDVSIEANRVTFSANINHATNTSDFKVLSKTSINNTNATTITTGGGDVLLASNVDDETDGDTTVNGNIRFGEGLTINSNSGKITLGGGNNEGTGYAVGESVATNTEGIFLRKIVSLNSGNGAISIKGRSSTLSMSTGANTNSGVGIYGLTQPATINSGLGTITIEGVNQNPSFSSYSSGIDISLNTNNLVTITSANTTANAINITATATGTNSQNYGMQLLNDSPLRITSTATTGGGIILNTSQNATSDGLNMRALADLDILSKSGPINLIGGANSGTFLHTKNIYLGSRAGTDVTTSSSNIILKQDRFSFSTDFDTFIRFATTGTITIEPVNNSFSFTSPYTSFQTSQFRWNQNSQIMSGLTIGKLSNATGLWIDSPVTSSGDISLYGGTIVLNVDQTISTNLTSNNGGSISLFTDSPLGGLTSSRTIYAAGAFKYIPRTTTFSADITYPIANLNVSSTGLTIGNATNDKNITINANLVHAGNVELYGNNLNINGNLTTSAISAAMHLKGNTTIAAGKAITSGGNFTHDGNMTFKSTATGTAAFGTLGGTFTTVSGNTTVERYFPAKRVFRFVSSAVTTTSNIRTNWQENGGTAAGLGTHITGNGGAANGFDPTGTNSTSIFTFNNNSGAWEPVGSTISNTLTAGTPYRLNIRGDRTLDLSTNTPTPTVTTLRATGTLYTGQYNPGNLSSTVAAYNFVGNPYQAPVNMKTVVDNASNIYSQFYYVWDPRIGTRGAYITVDLNLNTPNNGTSAANKFLQPGQACFIRTATTGITPILNFQESYKDLSGSNNLVFRNSNQSNSATSNIKMRLYDSNSLALNQTALDGSLIFFDDTNNNGVDENDGAKFTNPDEMFSTFNSGALISIEKRMQPTTSDIIPIRISQYRGTNYTIVAQGENLNGIPAYLHDQFLQTYTEIPQSGSVNYPYTVVTTNTQTTATDRFRIVYSNPLLSTANNEWKNFTLYPNPSKQGNFNIILGQPLENGKVTIYNTLGVKVYNQDLENTIENSITPNQSMSTGVYYVEIQNGSERSIKKLIIE